MFGYFLAVSALTTSLLTACATDPDRETEVRPPTPVATIACVGNIVERSVTCTSPQGVPGPQIFGGQGSAVALRSSNVHYDSGTEKFTFDVTLQNVSGQIIGWNGGVSTPIDVFFQAAPVATGGTGTIDVDNAPTGSYTDASQWYYSYPGPLNQGETSAAQGWQFNIPPSVTTFTFTVLISTYVFDQDGVLYWQPLDSLGGPLMVSVAYGSPTWILAAGSHGVTSFFNGSSWVASSPTTNAWSYGAAYAGNGQFIAVGDGSVRISRGKVWTTVYQDFGFSGMSRVAAKDTGNFALIGSSGRVLRYTTAGGFVATTVSGLSAQLSDIAISPNGDTVVVATYNDELYRSVGGGSFSVFHSLPNHGPGSVAWDPAGGLVHGGIEYDNFYGYVIHGTDTVYKQFLMQPVRLAIVGPKKVLVTLLNNDTYTTSVVLIDYTTLPATVSSRGSTGGTQLGSIAPGDANGATWYGVGSSVPTDLLYYNGSSVAPVNASLAGYTFDVWGIGDSAYIANGSAQGVVKLVDGQIEPLPPLAGARSVWGVAHDEVYALTANQVWRLDGDTLWTLEYTMVAGANNHQIWGDSTTGFLVVTGENGELATRTGGVWASADIPYDLTDVWGCSADDVWVGTTTRLLAGGQSGFTTLVTSTPIRGISGRSCSDRWVVGDNLLRHWNGSFLDSPVSGPGNLTAVVPRDAGEAYVVTANGAYLISTDAAGSYIGTWLPSQTRTVTGLWRLANGEVIAGGSGFVLRGLR